MFAVGRADSGTSLNEVGGLTRGPLLFLCDAPLGSPRAAAATERRDVRLARSISSCSAAVLREGESGFCAAQLARRAPDVFGSECRAEGLREVNPGLVGGK